LGVIFSKELSWRNHIEYVVSKSIKMLGLLKCSLPNAPYNIKILAYKALVRPVLEYAGEVWDPHTKSHADQIEAVQSKAIRFIKNLKGWNHSVTHEKKVCGLEPLAKRRQAKRIAMFHCILSNANTFPSLTNTLNAMNNSSHTMNTRTKFSYNSLACSSPIYWRSFLIRTSRELRTGAIVADF